MLKAFIERRPWVALVLSLILSPVLGMLYLGRGWLAVLCLFFALLNYSFFIIGLIGPALMSFLCLALILVESFYCFYLASRKSFVFIPKWYSRWQIIPLFCLCFILMTLSHRSFVSESFSVPASSMAPTVLKGDSFLAEKFAYGYSRYSVTFLDLGFEGRILARGHLPKRGDVVRSGYRPIHQLIISSA